MSEYTTVEKVENYMDISIDTELEDTVEAYIKTVSSWIENYCGDEKFGKRIFSNPVEEERYFDGNGKSKLYIGDALEVDEIKYEYTDIKVIRDEGLDFAAYPLNRTPKKYIKLKDYRRFESGISNIKVKGKWGYSEEAPSNVELAATKLVAGVLKENTNKETKEIKSETFDDYRVQFQDIEKMANTLSIDDLLAAYKRKELNQNSSLGTITI